MKKGQVTIFIILAIIFVALFALFFVLKGMISPKLTIVDESNSELFMKSCTKDTINEVVNKISSQGGYLNRERISRNFMFSDEEYPTNISYLCYTEGFYSLCINQEPLLIKHITNEIKENIKEKVNSCFNEYITNLKNRGFETDEKYEGFNLTLFPGRILIKIKSRISVKKANETIIQKNPEIIYYSHLYDLAIIAQKIVNGEAKYCNFDQGYFMIKNPDILIDKFRTGDSTTIYRIIYKKSKEVFKFATRGCVYAPGF